MPGSFTQLTIWKQGYELVIDIYKLTALFPPREQFGLVDQLRRSSNSVISNIAESHGRYSYNDKIRVLYIARGEIQETRSHLAVAKGLQYIDEQTANAVDERYETLLKSLHAYIASITQKRTSTNPPINKSTN